MLSCQIFGNLLWLLSYEVKSLLLGRNHYLLQLLLEDFPLKVCLLLDLHVEHMCNCLFVSTDSVEHAWIQDPQLAQTVRQLTKAWTLSAHSLDHWGALPGNSKADVCLTHRSAFSSFNVSTHLCTLANWLTLALTLLLWVLKFLDQSYLSLLRLICDTLRHKSLSLTELCYLLLWGYWKFFGERWSQR